MKYKTSAHLPKYRVENFLNIWIPKIAYILGYFAADGTMFRNKRGSHYIAFTSTDKKLITQVKRIMRVSNKVESYTSPKRWKTTYKIQIGSKSIYNQLAGLGFTPNKSLTLKYPPIPDALLGHFLRGYFDGDGCAIFRYYKRKNRPNPARIISIRLRCGSKAFIEQLRNKLMQTSDVGKGYLYFHDGAYELVYSAKDVVKLFRFMYPCDEIPYLERKFRILQEGLKSLGSKCTGLHDSLSRSR